MNWWCEDCQARVSLLHDCEKKAVERSCGDCQKCCTDAEVAELGKPVAVTCQHVCNGGCAIYKNRPESCAAFKCAYLDGTLPGGDEFRPNRLGVMLEKMHLEKPDGSQLYVLVGMVDDEQAAFDVASKLKPVIKPGLMASVVSGDGGGMIVATDADAQYFTAWMSYVREKGEAVVRYADGIEKVAKTR